ncbi:MAG: DUF924 domain-containing protein [Hyphomonadaceae bacterium]|nr:DUF924 domain-containing protein [Hyphomonadaceae bacterium]
MPDLKRELPTPGGVLDYWIGAATDDHLFANQQHKLWFTKSAATDAFIVRHFSDLFAALTEGLADEWAAAGARARLAAIIVLDQFSRNMFRGDARAFSSDPLARRLAAQGVEAGEDQTLTEIERSFFYLPFEHSEDLADQDESIRLFETLARDARDVFRPICTSSLDYAHRHRDIIRKYGRFPHRNEVLQRENTPEETDYLSKPGAGF